MRVGSGGSCKEFAHFEVGVVEICLRLVGDSRKASDLDFWQFGEGLTQTVFLMSFIIGRSPELISHHTCHRRAWSHLRTYSQGPSLLYALSL